MELFTIQSFWDLFLGRGYSTFPEPIGSLPSVILSLLSLLAAIAAAAALPEVYRKYSPDSRHSHAHSPNKLLTHSGSRNDLIIIIATITLTIIVMHFHKI